MKKLIGLILLLSNITVLYGQRYNKIYGKPVITLIETYPWLMVIGSDVPTFALYENGQVIYKKVVDKKISLLKVNLTKEEVIQTIKSFGFTDSLQLLPKFIRVSYATDQPNNELILRFDSLKQIRIYGYLRRSESKDRLKTPKSFLSVYDNIIKYDNSKAEAWLPDSIEVMLVKDSNSRKRPLTWPNNWPDLNNSSTVKRGDDQYSIYIDKSNFDDLIKLVALLKNDRTVKINGQKFDVYYRLPFPNIQAP